MGLDLDGKFLQSAKSSFSENLMSYLKLDQTVADPYTTPSWVQNAKSATPFDTRERAEAARVRIADASGVIHDDFENYWYVVKV